MKNSIRLRPVFCSIFFAVVLSLCAMLVVSCGGQPDSVDQAGVDFVNRTTLSHEQLTARWKQAQEQIAGIGVPLDVFSKPPTNYIRDSRALAISPRNVVVDSVPDIPVSQLPSGLLPPGKKDPSGVIACSDCAQYYVHSYVRLTKSPNVFSAASLVEAAVKYEFENIILHQLGYDVRNR